MTTISKNSFIINICGSCLESSDAEKTISLLDCDNINILDFDGLEDIDFKPLRVLLNARLDGSNFSIINAGDSIARKMEDCGVASSVNICRKPVEISLEGYEEFGGGFMSKAYNSPDGKTILKVYDSTKVPLWQVAREQMMSRAVMRFGIPTPFVGGLYVNDGNWAISFERFQGKRSLSRIISQEPDTLQSICIDFALMCRELHSKQCDTSIFPDRVTLYRNAILSGDRLDDSVKSKVNAFLDSVPARTTCLHGDMQLSNVISVDGKKMWIDLADFSYGNPMFDLGMWYFLSMLNDDEHCDQIFHLDSAQMRRCWETFAPVYFGSTDTSVLKEKEAEVQKFTALHMCYLCSMYVTVPWMMDYINKML